MGGACLGEAVPLHLVDVWYKARGTVPVFEVRRCTLKELVDHQNAHKSDYVMFPAPPVFPVEYTWWNPKKKVQQRRLSLTNLSSFTSGMDMLSSSVLMMGCLSRKRRSINFLNP